MPLQTRRGVTLTGGRCRFAGLCNDEWTSTTYISRCELCYAVHFAALLKSMVEANGVMTRPTKRRMITQLKLVLIVI